MLKFLIVLSVIFPFLARAQTLSIDCPGTTANQSFKIELQASTIPDIFSKAFAFPENAPVKVTETSDGKVRQFTGNVIFQAWHGTPKHGRSATYIFNLHRMEKQNPIQWELQNYAFLMAVNGVDDFEKPLECLWP